MPGKHKFRHAGLAEGIARWTRRLNRLDTEIPGLTLRRFDAPTDPTSYTLTPSLCLIGQGRKRVFLGEQAYVYDAHQFLINSVDLPLIAQISEASRDSGRGGRATIAVSIHRHPPAFGPARPIPPLT